MIKQNENRRVKLTKKLLKDSLIELMGQRPISKISVKMICEAADINRSTFYAHYSDTFALLEELERETFEAMMKWINELERHVHDKNDEKTFLSLTEILLYIKKNEDVFRVLLSKNGDSRFHQDLMFWVHRQTLEEIWETQLKNTKMNSYLQGFMAEGALTVIRIWLDQDTKESVEELAEFLLKAIYGGLSQFF